MTPETQTPTDGGAPAPPSHLREPNLKRGIRRFLGDENGQGMIEFVLIMPLFLFMLLGIMQFSLNACASYVTNLANFYGLRTAVVTQENQEANIGGHNVATDSRATVRYILMPSWIFPGDPLLTVHAFTSIAINTQLDGNFIRMRTNWNYPMVMPLAGNVIAMAMTGFRGQLADPNELNTVNNQTVITNMIPAVAIIASIFNIDTNFFGGLGAFFVNLPIRSSANQKAGADNAIPANNDFHHRMFIQRRR